MKSFFENTVLPCHAQTPLLMPEQNNQSCFGEPEVFLPSPLGEVVSVTYQWHGSGMLVVSGYFVREILSPRLDWAFCSIGRSCVFLVGLMSIVYGLTNSVKHKFLCKFGFHSHSTIYTFNNYFTTVFLVISFKRYPNTPLKAHLHLLKSVMMPNHIVTNLKPNWGF